MGQCSALPVPSYNQSGRTDRWNISHANQHIPTTYDHSNIEPHDTLFFHAPYYDYPMHRVNHDDIYPTTPPRALCLHNIGISPDTNTNHLYDPYILYEDKRIKIFGQQNEENNMQIAQNSRSKMKFDSLTTKSNDKDTGSISEVLSDHFTKLPKRAIRTRCYRLKLDPPYLLSSQFNYVDNVSYNNRQENFQKQDEVDFGDDNSTGSEMSTTKLAISTAKIFRDIIVDKRGKIISQNARARRRDSRSERGKQTKKGVKSRQADKIKKANDVVDGEVYSYRQKNGMTGSKIESLIVVGEYDSIHQHVFHGSKKIRNLKSSSDGPLISTNYLPRQKMQKINNSRNTINNVFFSPISSLKNFHAKKIGNVHNFNLEYDTYSVKNEMFQYTMSQNTSPIVNKNPRDQKTSHSHLRGENNCENKEKIHFISPEKYYNNMNPLMRQDSYCTDSLNISSGFHSFWYCGSNGIGTNTMNITPLKTHINACFRTDDRTFLKSQLEGRQDLSTKRSRGTEFTLRRDQPREKNLMAV